MTNQAVVDRCGVWQTVPRGMARNQVSGPELARAGLLKHGLFIHRHGDTPLTLVGVEHAREGLDISLAQLRQGQAHAARIYTVATATEFCLLVVIARLHGLDDRDRKSTRLNSSH